MSLQDIKYIRPCPYFPDGLEFPWQLTSNLIKEGLIVREDNWPGDFHFNHTEWNTLEDEQKADRLLHLVENYK
jgi:hypothetical protein